MVDAVLFVCTFHFCAPVKTGSVRSFERTGPQTNRSAENRKRQWGTAGGRRGEWGGAEWFHNAALWKCLSCPVCELLVFLVTLVPPFEQETETKREETKRTGTKNYNKVNVD